MKFALIYSYDPAQTGPTEEEYNDWLLFDQAVKDAGVFVYESGFYAATQGQTVRVRGGEAMTEQGGSAGVAIAGFYILDVGSTDEAASWAQQIPTATYGQVEVRQVVEM